MKQKETTGKFVFPSVLRHFRLHHKNLRQKYLLSNTVQKTFIQPNTRGEATSYLTKWKKEKKNFGCPSVSKKSIWHTEYLYLLLCGFYRTTLRQVHHYSQRCGNDFRHFSRRIGSKCAPNSRISNSGTRCRQKKYSRN